MLLSIMPKPRLSVASLVVLLLICLFAPYQAQSAVMGNRVQKPTVPTVSPYRLNEWVRPRKYAITIEPDFSNLTFTGSETIVIDTFERSLTITINAAELEITKATISGVNHKSIEVATNIKLDPKLEQAQLQFPRQLAPGHYDLALTFKGRFNDRLHGLYASYYKDADGNKQMIATTQFESADARRMFPCFDEPAFKANFQLNAVVDPQFTAVSNAAIARQKVDERTNKKIIEFAETPRMSTYLLALIIGKLESTEPLVVNGVTIRVWTTPGKSHLGKYAREWAGRLLPYYDSYFHFPYPEKKLDLIALPDFAAGAMENLGAITFREARVLVDEKTASLKAKQTVAGILAHEMAHLWFGDLVTMKWWDDVWLNEGFATWMSIKAVEHIMPEWHAWDDFGFWRAKAMSTDALISTRPVCFHVTNPGEVEAMFDDITYDKGCAVIRMLEKFVNSYVFQMGVDKYIAQHAYGNASTHEFWQAIQSASGFPIVQMMKNWVDEPGYPLVTAELSLQASKDSKRMTLRQQRFLLNGDASAATASKFWIVPMAIKTWDCNDLHHGCRAAERMRVFKAKEESFAISTPTSAFIANMDGNGYYAVRYTDSNLHLLKPLVETKLNPGERMALLRDEWSEALAGVVPITQYLDITSCYKEEVEPAPAMMLNEQLKYLSNVIDDKSRPAFERFVQSRLETIKNRLGWTAMSHESDLNKQLRSDVLETLGTIGQDQAVISEAHKLFEQYKIKPDSVDANLLVTVLHIVSYNGGSEEYNSIKQLWKQAKLPEDEMRDLFALAYFQKPELLDETMRLCLSSDVRAQDGPNVIGEVIKNPAGTDLAWKLVEQNWKQICTVFSFHLIPDRIVEAVRNVMNTPEQESDLRSFLASHPIQSGASSYARTLEQVHINVVFKQQSGTKLALWLSKNFP